MPDPVDHIETELIDAMSKLCMGAVKDMPIYRIFGCIESVKLLLTHHTIDQLNQA